MHTMDSAKSADMKFAEDLSRIEVGIKRLKVHYDMFFVGALAHEPLEIRHQVERLIRRYSDSSKLKYAQRFQFNALVSRYNSLSELWVKTTRKLEEGDFRQRSKLDQYDIRERLIARARLKHGNGNGNGGGNGDEETMRRLYRRFVHARGKSSQEKRPVSYESFARGISTQAERLRKESGCAEIELRVVLRDQKVQVKARPGR